MLSALMKTAAGIAAAAGLAFTTGEGQPAPAYGDDIRLTVLTTAEIDAHASAVFARSDRDQDGQLSLAEYVSLNIVAAELSRLNGFVVVEAGEGYGTLALGNAAPSAMTREDHIRIDAVARADFYRFAGEEGAMSASEFAAAQREVFENADVNGNGFLRRGELAAFANSQAMMTAGV